MEPSWRIPIVWTEDLRRSSSHGWVRRWHTTDISADPCRMRLRCSKGGSNPGAFASFIRELLKRDEGRKWICEGRWNDPKPGQRLSTVPWTLHVWSEGSSLQHDVLRFHCKVRSPRTVATTLSFGPSRTSRWCSVPSVWIPDPSALRYTSIRQTHPLRLDRIFPYLCSG